MAHHIVVEGALGAGKTLITSIIAHYWKEKVERNGGQVKLFSNYELKDSEQLEHWTDWYEVARAQGSIICVDEAHTFVSNRSWGRYGQQIITDVLMYIRKMQAIIIYATPSVKNLDSRVRDIAELLIQSRYIPNKGFSLRITDFQTGQLLRTVFLPYYKAKKVFNLELYDTFAMVRHFPLPQNEREGNEFFKKLEEIHDEARENVKKLVRNKKKIELELEEKNDIA